jgi:hypothetical protein
MIMGKFHRDGGSWQILLWGGDGLAGGEIAGLVGLAARVEVNDLIVGGAVGEEANMDERRGDAGVGGLERGGDGSGETI